MLGTDHHPNLQPFTGVAGALDVPSNESHFLNFDTKETGTSARLILPEEMVDRQLPTLLGMGLQAQVNPFPGHPAFSLIAPRQKVGVIYGAWTEAGLLHISGFVYALDFPDVLDRIKTGNLGMCVQLRMPEVEHLNESTWRITNCVFTGVNIMDRAGCGFQQTNVRLLSWPEYEALCQRA